MLWCCCWLLSYLWNLPWSYHPSGMGWFGSIGVENDLFEFENFLDLWRGKIQFHILVNVDSNAWKFFICISSNSNFTKRQHSSTLLFSQVLSHYSLKLKVVYIFIVLYSSVGLYSDQITPFNTSATQVRWVYFVESASNTLWTELQIH